MFQQLVVNFANFRWNNSVFMQMNCTFKKYRLPKNFILPQFVVKKIANVTDFQSNNYAFAQKKKNLAFKIHVLKKVHISTMTREFRRFSVK